ncbi:hypothetical protein AOLI_G00156520 [Acnodon oligacanthus]
MAPCVKFADPQFSGSVAAEALQRVTRGCWSLSQQSSGGRQDTPWTGCQSIAGQTYTITHTFTTRGNLASPNGLTACLWTVGGIPRRHRENMQTTHREDPGRPAGDSNPGLPCCETTALPTDLALPLICPT